MGNHEIEYNAGVTKYWVLFVVFAILTILALMFLNQFFWVPLPFAITYLVLALRVM